MWEAATYICQLVESAKELVEEPDEVLCRALRRQVGEADYVREQDAAMRIFVRLYIKPISENRLLQL